MSVLEQYTYDGSRKPDFQTLPTLVVPDEAMPADGTEASGNEGDDREIQIREQLKEKAKANLVEIGRLQKAFHAAKKRGLIVRRFIATGKGSALTTSCGRCIRRPRSTGISA